jgi:hypothetical protein
LPKIGRSKGDFIEEGMHNMYLDLSARGENPRVDAVTGGITTANDLRWRCTICLHADVINKIDGLRYPASRSRYINELLKTFLHCIANGAISMELVEDEFVRETLRQWIRELREKREARGYV